LTHAELILTVDNDNVYKGQNTYTGQNCSKHLVDFP